MTTDKDVTEMTPEQLVEAYRTDVEKAVRSLWSRCIATMSPDDMRACGYEGLLQAREMYDPDADASFSSYAATRIRGAILDGRRRACWGPRTRDAKCHDDSTAGDLGEATRIESPEVTSTVSAGKNEMPPLQVLLMEPAEFGQMEIAADQGQDDRMTRQQLKTRVSEAMDQLGEIERAVVRLYDIEDKTLKQVADEMCCSKSWAAKLRERAIEEIKDHVRASFADEETDDDGETIVQFSSALAA